MRCLLEIHVLYPRCKMKTLIVESQDWREKRQHADTHTVDRPVACIRLYQRMAVWNVW